MLRASGQKGDLPLKLMTESLCSDIPALATGLTSTWIHFGWRITHATAPDAHVRFLIRAALGLNSARLDVRDIMRTCFQNPEELDKVGIDRFHFLFD